MDKRLIEIDVYDADDDTASASDVVEVWKGFRAEVYYDGEVIAFIHADGTFTCPAANGVTGR